MNFELPVCVGWLDGVVRSAKHYHRKIKIIM